jgi:hypothetical protein
VPNPQIINTAGDLIHRRKQEEQQQPQQQQKDDGTYPVSPVSHLLVGFFKEKPAYKLKTKPVMEWNRPAGVPSIRLDIAEPERKSLEDETNYGDEYDTKTLMNYDLLRRRNLAARADAH